MTGSVWNDRALRREAEYLHGALFNSPAPPEVQERYVQLHAVCFPCPDPVEKATTEQIVRLGLDAEAIECAFRLRGQRHLLTGKMHALLYLVEVRREYYRLFFEDSASPVKGKAYLVWAIVLGAGKALKGEFLIRSHRLD
ncbi:MAG: hypothetical protein H7039_22950 [Bryobacteraceae bacterium]|nr:hypothetical protein [Bryobacteraceae bacterium]